VTSAEAATLDWSKGLLPAVVQDADTGAVLMVGFMNEAALHATLRDRRATFFSRRRGRLWTKGETSGHFISVESVTADCDRDTLLVRGRPAGPVCHTGTATCFAGAVAPSGGASFLRELEAIIDARLRAAPAESYVARLAAEGPARLAQKVGEEGVEVALAAVAGEHSALVGESADLVFHLLVLLRSRGASLADVVAELAARHAARG